MNFAQKLSATVKTQLAGIQSAHDKRVVEAEARARRNLAKARTKQERDLTMLQLQREKLALRRELSEAKVATQKAKFATEKARKEAGDLTVGERLGVFGARLGKQATGAYRALEKSQRPKRKRAVRKAVGTATKATTKRKTITKRR